MHGAVLQITALPPGLRRFTLADLPRERWRNGAGWTRTVASADNAKPHDPPDWRVSLAELKQGAPFSLFPGMDRTAVLVRGGPVLLRGVPSEDDALRHWPLSTPGDLACFAGEWPMDNAPPAHEALVWNVMARRGQVRAEVQVLCGTAWGGEDGQDRAMPRPDHTLLWVLQGGFHALTPAGQTLFTLDADEGLHAQGHAARPGALRLLPDTPEATLVCTRLWSGPGRAP